MRRLVVRVLARLALLLIGLVVLCWCALTIWQAIGGPAFIECWVSTTETDQCSFFQQ